MSQRRSSIVAFTFALITGMVVSSAFQAIGPAMVSNEPSLFPSRAHHAVFHEVCKVHGEPMSTMYVSILADCPVIQSMTLATSQLKTGYSRTRTPSSSTVSGQQLKDMHKLGFVRSAGPSNVSG
jgi:hypothetical protein